MKMSSSRGRFDRKNNTRTCEKNTIDEMYGDNYQYKPI